MKFDSAIAAHRAFKRAQENGNLGDDLENAIEAEDLFSSELGEAATAAYKLLLEISERHPEAIAFQEFLIYLTWQQVMAVPIPIYFQQGLELCDRYLKKGGVGEDESEVQQIRELRASFLSGLSKGDDEDDFFHEDTVQGED